MSCRVSLSPSCTVKVVVSVALSSGMGTRLTIDTRVNLNDVILANHGYTDFTTLFRPFHHHFTPHSPLKASNTVVTKCSDSTFSHRLKILHGEDHICFTSQKAFHLYLMMQCVTTQLGLSPPFIAAAFRSHSKFGIVMRYLLMDLGRKVHLIGCW